MSNKEADELVHDRKNWISYGTFGVFNLEKLRKADILKACEMALK